MIPDPAKPKALAQFRTNTAEAPAPVPSSTDATLEFAAETKGPRAIVPAPAVVAVEQGSERRKTMLRAFAGLAAVVLLGAAGWFGYEQYAAATANGSLRVESDPPGAEVLIDGAIRGTTPLAIVLPVATYTLTVRQGANEREMPVEIVSGVGNAYHITWTTSAAEAAPAPTGSLSITSDAPASSVNVDGVDRGQAPLTVRDLTPGPHDVIVRSGNTTYRRSVQVEAGSTASLVITATTPAPAWGWVTLSLPFPAQVFENGRVIGTSEIDRIMLPPGEHEIEVVSDPFGFRQGARVRVAAGRAAAVPLTIPQVPININAIPWAEISIDGVRIGDTPLANVMQPLGDHEIVFRHPQLGEKRQMMRVTRLQTPRVSVDMRAQ